jgi:hypothetical protein
MFMIYLTEIQNRVTKTWRIPIETIQEFGKIANFQASHHSMWLQAKRDPAKEWLQLKYCVTMQDIQMEVQEWLEEWRTPTIPKMVPGAQTRMQDRTVLAQQTGTNGARKKKNTAQGQEGGSSPIQKKTRMKKKSQCGSTQGPPHIEKTTRETTEQVHLEERKTETQEISMEEGEGQGHRHGYTDARSI